MEMLPYLIVASRENFHGDDAETNLGLEKGTAHPTGLVLDRQPAHHNARRRTNARRKSSAPIAFQVRTGLDAFDPPFPDRPLYTCQQEYLNVTGCESRREFV